MASQDRRFLVAGGFSHRQRNVRYSCIALGTESLPFVWNDLSSVCQVAYVALCTNSLAPNRRNSVAVNIQVAPIKVHFAALRRTSATQQ